MNKKQLFIFSIIAILILSTINTFTGNSEPYALTINTHTGNNRIMHFDYDNFFLN